MSGNTVEIVTKLDVAPALDSAQQLSQKLAKIPDVKIVTDASSLVSLGGKLKEIAKGQLVQVIVETVGEEALNRLAELLNQIGEKVKNANQAVQWTMKQLSDAASQAALEVDEAREKLSTITTEADSLTTQVRELGASLNYAVSTSDLLAGTYEVLSSGFSNSADTLKILEVSAKGATAGFSQTATVVDALTSTLNAYGEGADKAAQRVDQFIQIQNLGKLTVNDLSQSLGNVVTTAAQAGVSFEEVGGFIATATTKGVSASEAITGLNQALSAVLSPTDQAKKLAEELGIQFDATALRTKGLSGILAELQAKGADSVENLNILFGSVEALRTILPATGDGAETLAQAIEKISKASGTTDIAFAQVQEGLGSELARLTGQIQELLAQLGEGANAVITPLVQALNKFLSIINSIPEPIKRVVGGVAAFLGIFAGVIVTVGITALKIKILLAAISLLKGGLNKLGINFDTSGLKLQAWILALTGSVGAAGAVGTALTALSFAQSKLGQSIIASTKALIFQGAQMAKTSGILEGVATQVKATTQMIDKFTEQTIQKLNKFSQVTAGQIPTLNQEASTVAKVSAARAAYNDVLQKTIALKQKEAALLDRADILGTTEPILKDRVQDTEIDLEIQKINVKNAKSSFRLASEEGRSLEELSILAENLNLSEERLTIAKNANTKATEQLNKVQRASVVNAQQLASVQEQLETSSERAAKAKENFNNALEQAQAPTQKATEATSKSKNALMGFVTSIGPMIAQMALMYAAFETLAAVMRTFEDGAAELTQTIKEIDTELDRLSKKRDSVKFAEPPKDADWLDPVRRFVGATTLAEKRVKDVYVALENSFELTRKLQDRTNEILASDVGVKQIGQIGTALREIATGGAVTETQLKNIQKALSDLPASVPAEAIAAFQKQLADLKVGDSLSPEKLKELQVSLENLQGTANNTAIQEQIQMIDKLIQRTEEQLKVQGLNDFDRDRAENTLKNLRNQKAQLEANKAVTVDLTAVQSELAKSAEEAAKEMEEAYKQALEGIRNAEQQANTEIAQAQAAGAISASEANQQRLEAKRATLEEELKLAQEAGKDTAKIEEEIAKTEIELQKEAKDKTIEGIDLRKKAIEAYYDSAIKGQEALAQKIDQESKRISKQIDLINEQITQLNLDKDFKLKNLDQELKQAEEASKIKLDALKKELDAAKDKEAQAQIQLKIQREEQQLAEKRQRIEQETQRISQEAAKKELALKKQILELEIKQQQLAARKAEVEAKKAVLQATKEIKAAEADLQKAQIQGDKEAIQSAQLALEAAKEGKKLAEDQLAFAKEELKIQKEIAKAKRETFDKQARNQLQEQGLNEEAENLNASMNEMGTTINKVAGGIQGMSSAMDKFGRSIANANSALGKTETLLGKIGGMSLNNLLGKAGQTLGNMVPNGLGGGGLPGGASVGNLLGRERGANNINNSKNITINNNGGGGINTIGRQDWQKIQMLMAGP